MDLEEARDISKMGWPENQKAQRQHDAVDWLCAEVDRLLENVAHQSAANTELRAELSRLTLSAAESQREVERLKEIAILLDEKAMQYINKAAACEEWEEKAQNAEAERDKYKAALESQTALVNSNIITTWPDIAGRLIAIAKEALTEAVRHE